LIEDLLPWLYLKGVSTGDFSEALAALLGPEAPGPSASTITRLKADWWDDYERWSKRDLSARRYVYFWADGVYFTPRMDEDRQCMLVIIGAPSHGLQANHCRAMDEWGNKDVLGLIDGFRESTQSWRELLVDLKHRGLDVAPKLAIGDEAMGFWAALHEVYGMTRVQRCWVHKTANVLNAMPKSVQPKAKAHLKDICPLGHASMPCRVTDGGNQGRGGCRLRFLRRGLWREIPGRRQMPLQGPRRFAGVL
jgi:transposase-like protein